MKKVLKYIFTLTLIAVFFVFAGCGLFDSDSSNKPSTKPTPKEKIQINSESVEASFDHIYGDSYTTTIKGIAKNISGKELSYVAISYNIYDADGNQIGIALDNIANLAAGGTWKFSASGALNGQPAKYKLAEIQAF